METLPAGQHHPKDQRLLPQYQTVQGHEWGEGPVEDKRFCTNSLILSLQAEKQKTIWTPSLPERFKFAVSAPPAAFDALTASGSEASRLPRPLHDWQGRNTKSYSYLRDLHISQIWGFLMVTEMDTEQTCRCTCPLVPSQCCSHTTPKCF